MNTYVPVRKIIKIVVPQRGVKRDRVTSLQDCLDQPEIKRKRFRWRNLLLLVLVLGTLAYIYSHRRRPSMTRQIVVNEINYIPPDDDNRKSVPHIIGIPAPSSINLNTEIESLMKSDDLPHCIRKKLPSKASYKLNFTSVNISDENIYPMVTKGGYYRPLDCKPKHRVGIIVPYRNRKHNLGVFLYNIHPFLMKQKIEYQIFVIEQDKNDTFNKGRVFNAGFKEMLKFNNFHCVILHDLDLLPMDEHILYNCPTLPRHMCSKVNAKVMRKEYANFSATYKFRSLFGGVVSMTVEQYERANGFSNLYFGWGGEDNDMFWRLRAAGYPVVRYNKSVGSYIVLPHVREPANPFRHHLLSGAVDRYRIDGLSNIEYLVVSTKFRPLCTHIVVDINPREENIKDLIHKWGSRYHKN